LKTFSASKFFRRSLDFCPLAEVRQVGLCRQGRVSDGSLVLLSSAMSSKLAGSCGDLAEILGFDWHRVDIKKRL